MSAEPRTVARKGASRLARTIRSLLVIVAIGASLALLNIFTTSRDVATATGPAGPGQREFFRAAAERPDLDLFYKGLTSPQRIAMAERLGDYDDPEVAEVAAKLLGTFDADARTALQQALIKIAKRKPQSVVDQLSVSGSFQQLAIGQAMQEVGASAIPLIAEKLKTADTSANATALLVDFGQPAVPFVLPLLEDKDAAVRLAAADTLGKLREPSAVPKLESLYASAKGDERVAYLSAIASIGDPRSEPLLRAALEGDEFTVPVRSQAALGMGRVATPSSTAALVPFLTNPDRSFAESALSGLILAGDAGLRAAGLDETNRLKIAGGVRTAAAREVIERALKSAPTMVAVEAASGWKELVPALAASIHKTSDGRVQDGIAHALASTPEGRKQMETLLEDPLLGGIVYRRLRQVSG